MPSIQLFFYPSTKTTTGELVGELVLWYGMFVPTERIMVTTALAVGLHLVSSFFEGFFTPPKRETGWRM